MAPGRKIKRGAEQPPVAKNRRATAHKPPNSPQIKSSSAFPTPAFRLPWPAAAGFIIILFCALFALQLGVLEPSFHFQAMQQVSSIIGAGTPESAPTTAFAAGNSILLFIPQGNSTTALVAKGSGTASSLQITPSSQGMEISEISVNGRIACTPCNFSEKHQLGASGALSLEIHALANAVPQQNITDDGMPFFEISEKTHIDGPLTLSFDGWSASPDTEMPSSFYGVDAPFHINRIPMLANYLSSFTWPWAGYTFLSAIPPTLLYMGLGASPEYAYKIYEIALFFIPIILFRLFSSKLPQGKEAAFLLSSLLYLFLPSRGMITGSGTDLFMLGMTAHTLATYLSLFSLYFAYEFVFEKKAAGMPLATIFFTLATFSNQRILLPMCIGLAVLFALSLAAARARRAVLVGAACFFAIAWFIVPFLISTDMGGYSRLGGADTAQAQDAVYGFFFIGYIILPVLFAIGILEAFRQRSLFPFFISAAGIITYAIATSPELNSAFPFMDGLRLLPSFFLPVFFLSGIGAAALLRWVRGIAAAAAASAGMDRHTAAIAFMMAFALPLAVLFLVAVLSTTEQYASAANSLAAASEYHSLQQACSITGNERVLFLPGAAISQYPIYAGKFGATIISYYSSPAELAQQMEGLHAKYLVLGNAENRKNTSQKGRAEQYFELKNDSSFAEAPISGPFRLFALRENISFSPAEVQGGKISDYIVKFDAATISGTCSIAACNATIFSLTIPTDSKCTGVSGCAAHWNAGMAAFEIGGIPQGNFTITLAPVHDDYYLPSILLSMLLLVACVFLAYKMG